METPNRRGPIVDKSTAGLLSLAMGLLGDDFEVTVWLDAPSMIAGTDRIETNLVNRGCRSPLQFVTVTRYLASQAHLQETHFLWRPFLPDADDDLSWSWLLPPEPEILLPVT